MIGCVCVCVCGGGGGGGCDIVKITTFNYGSVLRYKLCM